MKKTALLLIVVVTFFSCRSSKKVVDNKTERDSIATNVEKETILDSTEDKEENTNIIENDEETKKVSSHENESAEPLILDDTTLETFDHSSFDQLLQKFVSVNGNVNYASIKNERTLLIEYISALGKEIPTADWSREDKLAYWINTYNALTIDLILKNYPLNSIKDIKDPWDQRLWKFGDKWLNLNDIEHKILRKMNEPRIHFAIVCASESCPKLLNEAFTANKLESQLANATKSFLSDTSKNEISENNIRLSKIFKWFAKDFKDEGGSLIDFLNQYTDVTISDDAKKSFKDYDWSLNN